MKKTIYERRIERASRQALTMTEPEKVARIQKELVVSLYLLTDEVLGAPTYNCALNHLDVAREYFNSLTKN